MATRIVFLDRETLPPETVLRPPVPEHELICHPRTVATDVMDRIGDADIVITNKVRLSREMLAAAPRLKFIAVAATGTDVVDIAAAREMDITVSNIRGYALATVPEHVFGLILALRRSILQYRQSVAAGRWQDAGQFCYFDYPICDLAGSTLGIIGSGALGEAVARLGEAFGMKVLRAERRGSKDARVGRIPFEDVLRQSDVITLHAPLTPETRNLIGAAEFAMMERRPLLINAGRGGLVDETVLGDALASQQIAGAGFDVATAEPPAADHPLMRLLNYPNFILTPHIAWASAQATQVLADQLIDNIDAFLAGHPKHVV
jgi:glycerate dehydrogenase